jgi:hypothetical protein
MYIQDMTLYDPRRYWMDPTVLDLVIDFEITNMGQLNLLFENQIIFNLNLIQFWEKGVIHPIPKLLPMNNSHSKLLPISPDPQWIMEESVLEAEENRHYQSIIGVCIYHVSCRSPDLAYLVSYLSKFLNTPSKSHLTAAKHWLWYINGTKDLNLSFLDSDASDIILRGYSNSKFEKCLDTQQRLGGNLLLLNKLAVCLCSKKHKSVASFIYNATYMALALNTKRWNWLMDPLEEFKVSVTNPPIIAIIRPPSIYHLKLQNSRASWTYWCHLSFGTWESWLWKNIYPSDLISWISGRYLHSKTSVCNCTEIKVCHYWCTMRENFGFWRTFHYIDISLPILIVHFMISSSLT